MPSQPKPKLEQDRRFLVSGCSMSAYRFTHADINTLIRKIETTLMRCNLGELRILLPPWTSTMLIVVCRFIVCKTESLRHGSSASKMRTCRGFGAKHTETKVATWLDPRSACGAGDPAPYLRGHDRARRKEHNDLQHRKTCQGSAGIAIRAFGVITLRKYPSIFLWF